MKKNIISYLLLIASVITIMVFATGCPSQRTVQNGTTTNDTSGTGNDPKRKLVVPQPLGSDTSGTGNDPQHKKVKPPVVLKNDTSGTGNDPKH